MIHQSVSHIFTTCCTPCRDPDIRLRITDNETAERSPGYQNIQVVGKQNLKWGQALWLAMKPEPFVLAMAGSWFNQQFLCKMTQHDTQQPQVSCHADQNTEWPLLLSAYQIRWSLRHQAHRIQKFKNRIVNNELNCGGKNMEKSTSGS